MRNVLCTTHLICLAVFLIFHWVFFLERRGGTRGVSSRDVICESSIACRAALQTQTVACGLAILAPGSDK